MLFFLKLIHYVNNNDDASIKVKFINQAYKLSLGNNLLTILILLFIRSYNIKFYEIIAVFNNLTMSISSQIMCGIIRSILFTYSDPHLLFTTIEISVIFVIVTYFYQSFRIMGYSGVAIILYLTISMNIIHEKIPTSVLYYVIIKSIVFAQLTIYSKIYEDGKLKESTFMNLQERERNYYIGVLDKLIIY